MATMLIQLSRIAPCMPHLRAGCASSAGTSPRLGGVTSCQAVDTAKVGLHTDGRQGSYLRGSGHRGRPQVGGSRADT